MTIASFVAFAAEEAEHGNVALETFWYGLVSIIAFAILGLVTLSYRNVANRHAHKAEAYARSHVDDAAGTGHGH